MRVGILVLSVIALSVVAAPARADDRYYMMIFGQQTQPLAPRLTHTFALFVKASGDASDAKDCKLEYHTISWMPASLDIRVLARFPEPGVNLSVEESLRWANSVGAGTWMWGPFEVRKELYDMAVRRVALLNSGRIGYICLDRRYRGGGASNCIHAVSDLDVTQGPLMTGRQCGNAGSTAVLGHLSKWIIPSRVSNAWLVGRLGLNRPDVQLMSPEARAPAAETAVAPSRPVAVQPVTYLVR